MVEGRPLLVGLTGGIGAGKSAALAMFAELGAVTIDSDEVARLVTARGTAGFAAVLKEFGPEYLDPTGEIDRRRLAGLVFSDPAARRRLEAIVHPLVRADIRRQIAALPPSAIVVNAVPLLVEAGLVHDYDRIVVVESPPHLRLQRLEARGLSRAEALARMAAQADDAARRAVAWRVVVNDGSLDTLRQRVRSVWLELRNQAQGGGAETPDFSA